MQKGFESLSNASNLYLNASTPFRIWIQMLRIPFEYGSNLHSNAISNSFNLHSNGSNSFRVIRIWIQKHRIPFEWLENAFETFESLSNGLNLDSNASNLFRMVPICIRMPFRMVRICMDSKHSNPYTALLAGIVWWSKYICRNVYYPSVLPNVVFFSSQFRNRQFRNKGFVTTDMLEDDRFSVHYISDIFVSSSTYQGVSISPHFSSTV